MEKIDGKYYNKDGKLSKHHDAEKRVQKSKRPQCSECGHFLHKFWVEIGAEEKLCMSCDRKLNTRNDALVRNLLCLRLCAIWESVLLK